MTVGSDVDSSPESGCATEGYPLYTALAAACVKEPLPAPASSTTDPGRSCIFCII